MPLLHIEIPDHLYDRLAARCPDSDGPDDGPGLFLAICATIEEWLAKPVATIDA